MIYVHWEYERLIGGLWYPVMESGSCEIARADSEQEALERDLGLSVPTRIVRVESTRMALAIPPK